MTIYNDTGHCELWNKGTSYSKSIPNLKTKYFDFTPSATLFLSKNYLLLEYKNWVSIGTS